MAFPVVIHRCESRNKKAEHWRKDALKLWCWRRLLRVLWTARRSNQSNPKGSQPEYSLEGLMLKLKFRYFGHLMQMVDSLEKTLMLERLRAGGGGGNRGWECWMALLTQWTRIWANSGRQWRTGKAGVLRFRGRKESDMTSQLNSNDILLQS